MSDHFTTLSSKGLTENYFCAVIWLILVWLRQLQLTPSTFGQVKKECVYLRDVTRTVYLEICESYSISTLFCKTQTNIVLQ